MSAPPAVLSWSSGKDSAFAYYVAQRDGLADIRALLTTVNEVFDRVSIHGTRGGIVRRQAQALGLPLIEVPLPSPCPNDIYEARMAEALDAIRAEGTKHVVFGDLFLEDIRAYREANLARVGMTALFPLWGKPTGRLAREMQAAGVEAWITTVDPSRLDARFAGRRWDARVISELPPGIDPCGENGEFHTCVSRLPGFAHALPLAPGEIVEREGFVYADLTLTEP